MIRTTPKTNDVSPRGKKIVNKVSPATQRKKQLQRLEKSLDVLWSKIVHAKWNHACAWPGCDNTGNLAAHHFVHKSAGHRARWNLDNSCLLCYGCHIHKLHNRGNTEPVRSEMIKAIGQRRFDIMVEATREIWKPTLEELQELKLKFERILETISES